MRTDLRTQITRRSPPGLRFVLRRLLGRPVTAPVGKVRFGDLRRTTPIANDFGYRRGGPVDRYYIESFLETHREDVHGRVLEIGDSEYTIRYGGDRVTQPDVLHIDPAAPQATFVGDLAEGAFLPDDTFDAIILTQTLHLVFDFMAALRTVSRVLAPGGVLLLTVPGISNLDKGEWGPTWHYSFTHHSVQRMCDDAFSGFARDHASYGNVLTAVAFLHGLAADELTREELDEHHVEYSLIHTARIAKPRDGGRI